MLTQIFKNIIVMSAVGSLLSIFLLCLKPVTKKLFSPRWQYYIWLTVLLVMILPIRFSVPNRTFDTPVISSERTENVATEIPQTDEEIAIFHKAERVEIPTPKLPQNSLYYLAEIWIFGAIAVAFIKMTRYRLFLRTIHKSSEPQPVPKDFPKCLRLRKTDMLDAPLIVGLFRPTLFLPNMQMTDSDKKYILMHELTHYKRCDLLYKWFAMVVKTVHWFNPLAYITARQIDVECEVSCDFAVTSTLSDGEKNSYMRMILDLLENSKSNPVPLTTQMASGKRTIKRRFAMIRSKKTTGKVMSVISAALAAVMLSGTVFASGVISDFATDDYTVEIINDGEAIELENKAFIENGAVYVPLREIAEKAISGDEGAVEIKWDNGTIDVIVAYYRGNSAMYRLKIGGNFVKLRHHIKYEDYANNSVEPDKVVTSLSLQKPPILKNQTTYVTLKDMNYMLYGYTVRKDENNNTRKMTYTVYDKNGKVTETESSPTLLDEENTEYYEYNTAEYTVQRFFRFFSEGHIDTMKHYCTDNFINRYIDGDNVFGMKRATLLQMSVAPDEYLKSSNDFNVFVTVNMTPAETSVFDRNETSASFYAVLEHQEDGSYLIDEFVNGVNK